MYPALTRKYQKNVKNDNLELVKPFLNEYGYCDPRELKSLIQIDEVIHHLNYEFINNYMELPGRGEPRKENCKEWLETWGCPTDNYISLTRASCGKADCKLCCDDWVEHQTAQTTKRIIKMLINANYVHNFRIYLKHVIVSPDQVDAKLWIKENEKHIIDDQLKEYMKEIGFKGYTYIFHAWRKICLKCQKSFCPICDKKEPCHCDGDEYCKCQAPELFFKFSPHYHLIGYGMLERSDKFYERTSWTYKTIRYFNEKAGFKTLSAVKKGLKKLIRYELGHATLHFKEDLKCENQRRLLHTVRYCGTFSYNQWTKTNYSKQQLADLCPVCESKQKKSCSRWEYEKCYKDGYNYNKCKDCPAYNKFVNHGTRKGYLFEVEGGYTISTRKSDGSKVKVYIEKGSRIHKALSVQSDWKVKCAYEEYNEGNLPVKRPLMEFNLQNYKTRWKESYTLESKNPSKLR